MANLVALDFEVIGGGRGWTGRGRGPDLRPDFLAALQRTHLSLFITIEAEMVINNFCNYLKSDFTVHTNYVDHQPNQSCGEISKFNFDF